jgi:hypothetical protein
MKPSDEIIRDYEAALQKIFMETEQCMGNVRIQDACSTPAPSGVYSGCLFAEIDEASLQFTYETFEPVE